MPGTLWTTPSQHSFLLAREEDYRKCQAARSYANFWATLYEAWFKEYPEPSSSTDTPGDTQGQVITKRRAVGTIYFEKVYSPLLTPVI